MGTTANRGWPYPESSDFVADGATAIENLADAIDGSLGEGYAYVQTVYFTSSGSFTKASYPWLRALRVTVIGAGGGGGGCASTSTLESSEGAGGSSGGYAQAFITNIASLAASETITIGAGGAGGAAGANAGSNGGNSSALGLTGGGGDRGDGMTAQTGPFYAFSRQGGTASGGDINYSGSSGGPGIVITGSPSTVGLNNFGAASQIAGSTNTASSNIAGVSAAANSGGGGMGGRNRQAGQTAKAGGNGGSGLVIVELYA